MRCIVPCETYPEMIDFPYSVPKWKYGCTQGDHDLLHSLLFTFFDPDNDIDGMEIVYDFDGLKEWYDTKVPEDEKVEYNCPTVYDWLHCEIGRCVIPLKGVIK